MKREEKSKIDSSLAARMKRLREENQLTQRQVADMLNLERSSIAKYELGQSTPNPETLYKMAKIYNVTVDYLISGKADTPTQTYVSSDTSSYNNNLSLPLLSAQHMHDLTKDEQFLVLYFRLLDRDPEILKNLRQEYKKQSTTEEY